MKFLDEVRQELGFREEEIVKWRGESLMRLANATARGKDLPQDVRQAVQEVLNIANRLVMCGRACSVQANARSMFRLKSVRQNLASAKAYLNSLLQAQGYQPV
jgi:hypothetical protein